MAMRGRPIQGWSAMPRHRLISLLDAGVPPVRTDVHDEVLLGDTGMRAAVADSVREPTLTERFMAHLRGGTPFFLADDDCRPRGMFGEPLFRHLSYGWVTEFEAELRDMAWGFSNASIVYHRVYAEERDNAEWIDIGGEG